MKKIMFATAVALVIGAGSVSAQESVEQIQPLPRANAHGLYTASASSRDVGPASSAAGYAESPLGSANSGLPDSPYAPSAGSADGGGGH
jgi:hypothetical protein